MGKFRSTVSQKTFILITAIVFCGAAFSFLLTSNVHSGSSGGQTRQRGNLSAEVDLSKVLSVVSNGPRVTRVHGKVTNYILTNMYVVSTQKKQNLLVIDNFTQPVVGSDIVLEGQSTNVHVPLAEVQGLQILQLGDAGNGIEELVSVNSPVQTL